MVERLGPGSPAPRTPAEVESLLHLVPSIAFMPEVEVLLPAPLGDGPLTAQALADTADAAWLRRLADGLHGLEQRAAADGDGGLRFLAVTLRHFIVEQRIPAGEHPLVVALYLRTVARRGELRDEPAAVARALDDW